MNSVAQVLIGFVALEHVGFLVLEMFLWDGPIGRKVFRLSAMAGAATKALAANQGLYNGFLAAGLVWGLISSRTDVALFFLGCVIIAGIFGAVTVSRRIVFVQALPAALAMAAVLAAGALSS